MYPLHRLSVLPVLAAIAAGPAVASSSDYTFVPLSVPGAFRTVPKAINNSGEVVGYYEFTPPFAYDAEYPGSRTWHAFLWTGSSYRNIDVPGARWTAALNLDDSGHVYGVYVLNSVEQEAPFIFDTGTGQFTFPDVSWPDLLQWGMVAGMSSNGALAYADPSAGPFLYSGGPIKPITTLQSTGQILVPIAINTAGEILATAYDIYFPGNAILGASQNPAYLSSSFRPQGLGSAGEILGGFMDSQGLVHGSIFADGLMKYIDDPNVPAQTTPTTLVYAINSSGQIAGTYSRPGAGFVATPPPPAPSERARVYIDLPKENAVLNGTSNLTGWAITDTSGINAINIKIDGSFVGTAIYGSARPDVCAIYANQSDCPNVGWNYPLDTTTLADGAHTAQVVAISQRGNRAIATRSINIGNGNAAPYSSTRMYVDNPVAGATLSGQATLSGWAFDMGYGILHLAVVVDPSEIDPSYYYPPPPGIPRPDVCNSFANAKNCLNSGWSKTIDTTQLADGPHQLVVIAFLQGTSYQKMSVPFTVSNRRPIHLNVDQPSTNPGLVSGVLPISGWATDDYARASVTINVDDGFYNYLFPTWPITGTVISGGYRPDVCAVYPNSFGCPNVGWSALVDTTQLSNGSHTVKVMANASYPDPTSTAPFGQSVLDLATAPPIVFTVNNPVSSHSTKVFIDQPLTSQVLWNTLTVSGWALDDNTPIRHIDIYVDGKAYGFSQYSPPFGAVVFRPDVCIVYPNRPGCPNVGWGISLNTNDFSNGLHTLTAVAVTMVGAQGSASTTFNVQNSNGTDSTRVNIDLPSARAGSLSGETTIAGWATNNDIGNGIVTISIDGGAFTRTNVNSNRPDVCNVYPDAASCPAVGWSVPIDTRLFANGEHTLQATASFADKSATASTVFTVANSAASSPTNVYIDVPNASIPIGGVASFAGWAVNTNTRITAVRITVDGALYGNAIYGSTRQDVCAAFPAVAGCPAADVGWNFAIDTTALLNGQHTLSVTAVSGDGELQTVSTSFAVAN